MFADAEKEAACGLEGSVNFKSTLPDLYTKVVARELMKQLRENWRNGDIDMMLAKATTRVPFLKLVDFDKSSVSSGEIECEVDEDEEDENAEKEYEFSLLRDMHKDDHRTAVV